MLTELKSLLPKLETLKYRKQEIQAEIAAAKEKQTKLKATAETIMTAITHYKHAADVLQYQRLEELLTFVNDALKFVYWDEKYEFRIELSDKYTKSLQLQLYDGKKDLLKPLRKGNGKGVKAVICYVLYVYFCMELGSEILWQDETVVNMSPRYVDRLFMYVRSLCETRGIAQLMITQDPRFIKHAHLVYTMDHGNLTVEQNEE